MSKTLLNENKTIEINENDGENVSLDFCVESKVSLLIKISSKQKIKVNVDVEVKDGSEFALLLLNSSDEHVDINDNYQIYGNSQVVIAYSQLNQSSITTNSQYNLLAPYANLKVLSVSITNEKNNFNQNVNHLASNTKAQVDNYGIVEANGNCLLVVKNVINKGYKQCETHQKNRLLTYDSSSVGKILPILIIDDNDVVASHAASLGQPDENQLYYLQSRGLTYSEALKLITIGYLMPITKIVDNKEVNEILKNEIETKVNGNVWYWKNKKWFSNA